MHPFRDTKGTTATSPNEGHLNHETYISAKQSPPQAQARFPWTNANPRGTCSAQTTPYQGSRKTVRVVPGSALQSYVSLRSDARFQQVYRHGVGRRSGGLTVIQLPNESGITEVGFVAGKRVGNAVLRNRAKRRLREAARRIDFAQHTSYVVVAKPSVLSAAFPKLVSWLGEGAEIETSAPTGVRQ